jgi:hypothetical protein
MTDRSRGRPSSISPTLRAEIVNLYRHSGLGARDLAQILERAAVPAPFGGNTWHPSTITRLLRTAGETLPRGRRPSLRIRKRRPEPSPLHIVTQLAYKRRAPGSGSDLWHLLAIEGKFTPPSSRELSP